MAELSSDPEEVLSESKETKENIHKRRKDVRVVVSMVLIGGTSEPYLLGSL